MKKHSDNNKLIIVKKKAFTLIELLIVIAIIGILFVVLISKVDFATDKAKATGVQTDFRSFRLALETVLRENDGFNTFGWDTGDANANGKQDNYDEGDMDKDGIKDADEVWTGRKVPGEKFTGVFTLIKPGTTFEDVGYDAGAVSRLTAAINANLDPKLHITIDNMTGDIAMANNTTDPWGIPYHGKYDTNSMIDQMDNGTIVIYSNGANRRFSSEHTIANGIITVDMSNSEQLEQDDYALASIYTYKNGCGSIYSVVVGFGYVETNDFANGSESIVPPEQTPEIPEDDNGNVTPPEQSEPERVVVPGLYESGKNYAEDALVMTWQELLDNKIIRMNVLGDKTAIASADENAIVGDLVIAEGVSDLSKAFKDCIGLTDIKLSTTVINIDPACFNNCPNLNFETFNGITYISSLNNKYAYAFALESKTESSYILHEKTNVIGEQLFNSCSNLNEMMIPDSVYHIGIQSFQLCTNLKNITIGNNVKSIGIYAFEQCSSLEQIVIPDSVVTIGITAFRSCSNLKSAIIGNGVTSISDYCFALCEKLETVVLGNGLTSIGSDAFEQCRVLTEIVIPSGVTSIGSEAFNVCTNLRKITLSNNMQSLGGSCFQNCTSIRDIYFDGSMNEWNSLVAKTTSWNRYSSTAYVVHCSDGDISVG